MLRVVMTRGSETIDVYEDEDDVDDGDDFVTQLCSSHLGSVPGAADNVRVVYCKGIGAMGADTENQGGKIVKAAPARWRFTEPSTADLYFGLQPIAASARACPIRDRGKEGYKSRDGICFRKICEMLAEIRPSSSAVSNDSGQSAA